MCGIAGAFDTQGRRLFPAERLDRMGAALEHRGPDASGTHLEPGLAMVVRRLALVDPEHGAQPMALGGLRLSVNGELFAHRAERTRLEGAGTVFRTASDTEVWLQAWRKDGPAYLERAHGQFALAMWSSEERTLWLARDRFGICPLFLARADGWLLWASSARALFASGLIAPQADPRGIDHQLVFLGQSPVRTPFAGITPLGVGEVMELRSEGSTRQWSFGAIDFCSPRSRARVDRGQVIEALDQGLREAVKLRLEADAPVGLYLSGGVDSSLLAALAARHRKDLTAFSVRLEGVGLDEADQAATTARALGLAHVVVPLDAAALGRHFPAVVAAAESPVLDHANVCLLLLAREVRARGFKAVLTGEGADEAFGGYPWIRWQQLLSAGGGVARGAVHGLLSLLAGGGRMEAIRRGHLLRSLAQAPVLELMGRARERFYSSGMRDSLQGWVPSDDHRWELPDTHPLNQSLFADYRILLRGHLLADKGDRMAMASSVEPRFPYLDEKVVALAASLPPELKVNAQGDKWILRQVARRYLPSSVALRRKHMFRAEPVIHGPGRPGWVDQLLSPESLQRTGYFDPRAVASAMVRRQRPSWSPRRSLDEAGLSGVVSTQLWHHLFLGGGLCELPVSG